MKSPTPPNPSVDRDLELAKLRADVARALSADKPDAAVLTAALERVDTMLSAAQDELAAAVREILDQLGVRGELRPT